jgi:glycosyltransferase involved in cell wall biosynthesis
MRPLVGVVLVVRNCASTVGLAVRSILAQSYGCWEMLIANDASSDGTAKVIESFRDERIRHFEYTESKGLAARLNELIDASRGKYLARMDGDDFAFPERLAKQVSFLEAHPEVDLVGCGTINFEQEGRIVGKSRVVTGHKEICARPWRGFPLYHPTWTGKTDWFRKYRYDSALLRSQDYELLLRACRTSRFACLEEPLLGYRVEQLTLGRQFRSRNNACKALLRHALRGHDIRCLQGVAEHGLKLLLDAFAIGSGLRYQVLRHRALKITEADRAAFNAALAALQSS